MCSASLRQVSDDLERGFELRSIIATRLKQAIKVGFGSFGSCEFIRQRSTLISSSETLCVSIGAALLFCSE
jgi:hypothetical protein